MLLLWIAPGDSIYDDDIFSLNPSKFAQLLPERVHEDRATGSSASIQEADAENFSRLLRLGDVRLLLCELVR